MKSISLSEMDEVSLMNRIDKKFYFHERLLPHLLMSVEKDYFVLEINGERLMPYESIYFDTFDFQMLRWHQNGKMNRYKIRKRKYLVSGESFLEIKFKNNKGYTNKLRRRNGLDLEKDRQFVYSHTPFSWVELKQVLNNHFTRIMLVNKNMKERVSIDIGLEFDNGEVTKKMDRLVLLEIKSERQLGVTELQRSLKFLHIYPSGFSKYVTGMYLFHPHLKFNRFKRRFKQINKTIEKTIL
jgi:hypothetical protein